MKYKTFNNCSICNEKIASNNVISLGYLPTTEIFVKSFKKINNNFKQKINYCKNCNHLNLAYRYDVSNFYNDEYLNSSQNFSNQHSNNIFIKFIEKNINKKKFNVIEHGANDTFLLEKFKRYCSKIIAIDPCIKKNKKLKNIKYIKKFSEDVQKNEINFIPEIVLCSQTLEHVSNPLQFLSHITKFGDTNTKYFFQFPSCESLLERNAFDQIHHQHINYFSLKSISKILKSLGFSIIEHAYNELHYGSLMIYFKKGIVKREIKFLKCKINIKEKYLNYQKYLNNIIDIVKAYKNKNYKIFAIGASLMTPILNHQLKGLLNICDNILDDDKSKIDKYFPNINSKIKSLKETDLKNSIIIISATASSVTIRKLVSVVDKKNPKIIIIPTLSF